MSQNYIYARDPATNEITIQIETPDNKKHRVKDVPSYDYHKGMNDLIDTLEREVNRLESEMEEADQRYEEEQSALWFELATRVNSLGHDPLSIITDELKKYGLYLEMRRAA